MKTSSMTLVKSMIVCAFVCASFYGVAQANKPLVAAFKQSYEYEGMKNYEAAVNALTAAYNESSYELNLRLGWLYYMSGKQKESIVYYQKASALMPAATEPLWGIINPYVKQEDWNAVEKVYQSILKLDAKNAKANYNLGLIYFYRKDYVNAKKHFDVSLNLSPFGYHDLLMSAWTNYYLGNKNEASVLFNKTLLYSPNDKSALEGLSLIK
ncbi:MAG: tetratricopeptide repeat protein [Bacteroidetes bacterium]|nr:tetratricopeptide repeat protein [Bacteroidota bacterium]